MRINQQHVYVAYYIKQEKYEVITSKNFDVRLLACNFSKLISRSPMDIQVLSRGAIYLDIQFKSCRKIISIK